MAHLSQRVVKRRGVGASPAPSAFIPFSTTLAPAMVAQSVAASIPRTIPRSKPVSAVARWRTMLGQVETSTLELERTAVERSAGTVKNGFELAGPHLVNPWEWVEQPAPSGTTGCPTELLVWADVWQVATTNLARLSAEPVPPINDPAVLALWEGLIERNLGLLGPASNLQPAFFSVSPWVSMLAGPLRVVRDPRARQRTQAAFQTTLPGYRTISGGTREHASPVGTSRLATSVEARGGGEASRHATTSAHAQVMREAPQAKVAGFTETLSAAPPIRQHWKRGVLHDVRSNTGLVLSYGGTEDLAVPRSWGTATPTGPDVAPGAQFCLVTPDGLLGKDDPSRGWALLVEAWARSNGAVQQVSLPHGPRPGDPPETALVDVDLSVYFDGSRKVAAYFSRLNLLDVTLRTVGFYATSYAPFAVAAGFPDAADFAATAGAMWTQLQRAATTAAHETTGAIVSGMGVGVGVIAAIFPPVAVFAAVAMALVEAISSLLLELGGAAVADGVYSVQPLFVRNFVGECSQQTLIATVENATGVLTKTNDRIAASREAMLESAGEYTPPPTPSTFPWGPVLGGSAALALLAVFALRKPST